MTIWIDLFLSFSKIGLFGFGGGLAMLPIIFQTAKGFGIDDPQEFGNLVAISQVTPGPLAINAATYVGYYTDALGGAFAATIGVALPSFVMVMAVSYFVEKFKQSKIVQGALSGVRPVTVGLVASAGYFMLSGLVGDLSVASICILLGTLVFAGRWKVNPFFLIVAAGVICAFLIR